jgi:UTP--glucose-1-phosphate uridylyltransferase
MNLDEELRQLPAQLRARLEVRGFRAERLLAWAASRSVDREQRNRLSGEVEPPRPNDVEDAPIPGSEEHRALEVRGLEALARGEVALCVLAGGMATRMGGVVKALVEALPGRSFLDLRLGEQTAWAERVGARPPLWLMVSEATRGPIEQALGARLDGTSIATFEQCVSLRLDPEGALFRDARGEPSVYATGHGDLPEALASSGLLDRFVARCQGRGVVWIANLDNLGATIDASLLGWHLAHGGPLSVEVVDKRAGDRGGVPVLHRGKRIIAEEFRLPRAIDPATISVFNTNTFLVDAKALRDLSFDFTYVEVDKKVDDRAAIQFERLLGELTAPLEPRFVRVPREGREARFLPVKDHAELTARRSEIAEIAADRGMVR